MQQYVTIEQEKRRSLFVGEKTDPKDIEIANLTKKYEELEKKYEAQKIEFTPCSTFLI